jgi:hypothetical protein
LASDLLAVDLYDQPLKTWSKNPSQKCFFAGAGRERKSFCAGSEEVAVLRPESFNALFHFDVDELRFKQETKFFSGS